MNYPLWDLPIFGSGLNIALIAVFHIFISHFAVGGGLYLPVLERSAQRHNKPEWMKVLRLHTKFFLILTSVFGATTGVAIWFAVGLGSPAGASTLIHFWVFAWAIEWCIFVIELTAIAVYYYLWDRVSPKTHLRIGWLYAWSSWGTLLVINGILGFMMTPTDAWLNAINADPSSVASVFWSAFFNPTYLPSTVARMLVMASLAGVFALITASRLNAETQLDLKTEIIGWSRRWLLPAFVLLPIVMYWYFLTLPPASQGLVGRGTASAAAGMFGMPTRMVVAMVISSLGVVVTCYLATAKRNIRTFGLGAALGIAFFAYVGIGSAEMAREMLRKPYVVVGYMYSNGVRPADVDEYNANGFLTRSILATDGQKAAWAAGVKDPYQGELMYRGQCLSCHTADGYRSLTKLLKGRNRAGVGDLLQLLYDHQPDSLYYNYMPQLVGTAQEIEALGDYLTQLAGLEAAAEPAAAPTAPAPGDPAPVAAPAVPVAPAAPAAEAPVAPAALPPVAGQVPVVPAVPVDPAAPVAPTAPVGPAAPTY